MLTPEQQNIIYSENKRKIIKGSFGTGKTVAAQQLLKIVLDNLSYFEFGYYLFHGSSSAYIKEMEKNVTASKNSNVVACNIADLTKEDNKLSSIFQTLLDIHEYDKTQTCHVFIEEFNGEVLDQEEGEKIRDLLSKKNYTNAHIVLVRQSMESDRYIIQDKNRMSYNMYQFENLVNDINFEMLNLSYLLRSSQHINKWSMLLSLY